MRQNINCFLILVQFLAQGSLYDNIIKKITKRARHLNITLRPDFGVKPEIILPTIVEQAVAAGTFQV